MGLMFAAVGQLEENLPLPHAKDSLANYAQGAAAAAAAGGTSSTLMQAALSAVSPPSSPGAGAPSTGVVASPALGGVKGSLSFAVSEDTGVAGSVGKGTPASPPRMGHDTAIHAVPSALPAAAGDAGVPAVQRTYKR